MIKNFIEQQVYHLHQFFSLVKESGLKSAFKMTVYFNKEVVLVERDILKPCPKFKIKGDLSVLTVIRNNLNAINNLKFSKKSRKLKCISYLRKGYMGFLGVTDNKVIAEQWLATPRLIGGKRIHPDLKWLELSLNKNDLYGFDLFITPEYRGTSVINIFMSSYIALLRELGFRRMFGFYAKENLPAMYIHRIFSFKESKIYRLNRFFLIEYNNKKLSSFI